MGVRNRSATPSISTSAYADGDLIGTKLTFTAALRSSGGASGALQSATLTDLAAQNAAIDLILFNADPTSTTFTDNAAFDIADADLSKVVARVAFTASDYFSFADNSVAQVDSLGLGLSGPSRDLYGALVSRGTPTYATASDLTVRIAVWSD